MRAAALLAVLAIGFAVALGGGGPFGRVLLSLGMPKLATVFLSTPEWRGVALYRAGSFEAAASVFAEAKNPYNLGNAYVHSGNYAAALEAYDLAIDQGHPSAQANFDAVAAFYSGLGIDPDALGLLPERKEGPSADSFIARGDARAAGTGSDVTNTNTMLGLVELDSRGRLGIRRIFDDKFIVASDRWLEQLQDVPGEFMAARIRHEYKRRVKLGLSPPEPEDPR